MTDQFFEALQKKVDEIYALKPNDLHIPLLTHMYKLSTGPLKVFPFKLLLPASLGASIFLYLIFGYVLIRMTSILQYGF